MAPSDCDPRRRRATRRRRRRIPTLCVGAAALAASSSSSLAGVAGEGPPSAREERGRDREEGGRETPHVVPRYPHPPSLRRHLKRTAAETFASFTPERVRRATPLDLKLDSAAVAALDLRRHHGLGGGGGEGGEGDGGDGGDAVPAAYVTGPDGRLEPYARAFAASAGVKDDGDGEGEDDAEEEEVEAPDAFLSRFVEDPGERPEPAVDVDAIMGDFRAETSARAATAARRGRPEQRHAAKDDEPSEEGIRPGLRGGERRLRDEENAGRAERRDAPAEAAGVVSVDSIAFRFEDEAAEDRSYRGARSREIRWDSPGLDFGDDDGALYLGFLGADEDEESAAKRVDSLDSVQVGHMEGYKNNRDPADLDAADLDAFSAVDIGEGEVEDEDKDLDLASERGRSLQAFDFTQFGNRNKNRNNNNKKNGNNNKKKEAQKQASKLRRFPRIDRLVPSPADDGDGVSSVVSSKQAFGARVSPSSVTRSPVAKVSFQLTDHTGAKSDRLSVPEVEEGTYEIVVNGFEKYPGTPWRWDLYATDANGKTARAEGMTFRVADGAGRSGGGKDGGGKDDSDDQDSEDSDDGDDGTPSRAPPAPSPSKAKRLPHVKTSDADWRRGGTIQKSTGRILFEFDDSGQTYVCSGTVVCDGADMAPDGRNGRSVIQTAAHCGYNDVMKKFATRAIFIPDQDSTRGDKSDFDCKNDRYGCWILSFATVAGGWTTEAFPMNVQYDYAYYTVFDDEHTHAGGYTKGLTGVLDRDIPCVPIDFDMDPRGEFIHSVGYSADKDPALRHCAMTNAEINGVPWYANLWLDDCAMTGGASGGPWMYDLDEDGRGTLVSVNSWGFADKPGMAGPQFRTRGGSLAECLFERAKEEKHPGRKGGVVVFDC
ncbi:hypothetical protein ACHAWF_017765 [Thalassiosira exigua]